MTSADFSAHRNLIYSETSPGKNVFPSFNPCSIYCLKFGGQGRYKDVVAYPFQTASYTVSVRQYRILQSRFLQSIPHGKPPCDLLTGFTNLPVRDFPPERILSSRSPSGKKTSPIAWMSKIYLYF